MACVLAAGVHGPGNAVQWEIPVRLHAGRSHAGTAEMDSVFARVAQLVEQPPCKRQVVRSNRDRGHQGICHVRLAGSGHKVFILVDRGSNPLRDAR